MLTLQISKDANKCVAQPADVDMMGASTQQRKEHAMHKLLAAFAENYHAKPRVALLRYLARHPMAECLLLPADIELVETARRHAREDAEYIRN
jgi:hypothetical protein